MSFDVTNSSDALIALIGTLFGGGGLELIRRALAKSKEREDSATSLRNELRTELNSLKHEMLEVEKELDKWKLKYYELFEKYLLVKLQYEEALTELEKEGVKMPIRTLPKTPLGPWSNDDAVDKEPQEDIE